MSHTTNWRFPAGLISILSWMSQEGHNSKNYFLCSRTWRGFQWSSGRLTAVETIKPWSQYTTFCLAIGSCVVIGVCTLHDSWATEDIRRFFTANKSCRVCLVSKLRFFTLKMICSKRTREKMGWEQGQRGLPVLQRELKVNRYIYNENLLLPALSKEHKDFEKFWILLLICTIYSKTWVLAVISCSSFHGSLVHLWLDQIFSLVNILWTSLKNWQYLRLQT